MTPEEFRTRAETATATVEPDALAYNWLRANVAARGRRRRTLVAGTAAGALFTAGVAYAVLPAGERAGRDVTGRPAPATPTRPVDGPLVVLDSTTADVDGDGRRDRVELVEVGDRALAADDGWRWGVRVRLATGEDLTAMRLAVAHATQTQTLVGVADVNRDGRAEVVVSSRRTPASPDYELVTLRRGRLTFVTGARLEARPGEEPEAGWGCDEDGVYTQVIRHGVSYGTQVVDEAKREYYRLRGNSLVPGNRTSTIVWDPDKPVPQGFGNPVRCGSIRE